MIWIASLFLTVLATGPQAKVVEVSVYFERNSAGLNTGGMEVLNASAGQLRSGSGPIWLEGHTSTLGSDTYNVGLSQRRANVVRDALVARGIASDRITTAAFGESTPARPTADGVHEPLNDRVVVRLLQTSN